VGTGLEEATVADANNSVAEESDEENDEESEEESEEESDGESAEESAAATESQGRSRIRPSVVLSIATAKWRSIHNPSMHSWLGEQHTFQQLVVPALLLVSFRGNKLLNSLLEEEGS
jgi:hypothetical protein